MAILLKTQIENKAQYVTDERLRIRNERIEEAEVLRRKVLAYETNMFDLIDTALFLIEKKLIRDRTRLPTFANIGDFHHNRLVFIHGYKSNKLAICCEKYCDYQEIVFDKGETWIKCVGRFNGPKSDIRIEDIDFSTHNDYFIAEFISVVKLFFTHYEQFYNDIYEYFERVTR